MTNFDMTIDEEKGSRTVKLLYSRIVHELNQIDPRMKFRVTDDDGTFKADFTLPDGTSMVLAANTIDSKAATGKLTLGK